MVQISFSECRLQSISRGFLECDADQRSCIQVQRKRTGLQDETSGGEHTEYTGVVLECCAPGAYIMLLTNVTSPNLTLKREA